MILDNGVIENTTEFAFEEKCSNLKKVPADYYFSDLVHDSRQRGH